MPSQLHEVLLLLFRNRPELAPELLRDALQVEIPKFREVRVDSADLTEALPAEYRADHVFVLVDDAPVLGIIVEVQLSADPRKRFAWPMYAAGLRARLECPVCLFVLTVSDALVRWAATPIDLGGGNRFTPRVLGLSRVPEIVDEAQARADPELAVLSAIAHGRDADADKALRIALAALAASAGLDPERSKLYCDLVVVHAGEPVRKELENMDPAKYEYQSEFAKRFIAQGRQEGRAEGAAEGELRGRAALVLRLLSARFGELPGDVHAKISTASVDELDAIGERLLTARTLQEALAQ